MTTNQLVLYLGCKISVTIKGVTERKIKKLVGIQQSWTGDNIATVMAEDRDRLYTFDVSEIKPILKPLSRISDDHKREVKKLMQGMKQDNLLPPIQTGRHLELYIHKDNVKVIDFLRSRGYAVGLSEEDYIKEGEK